MSTTLYKFRFFRYVCIGWLAAFNVCANQNESIALVKDLQEFAQTAKAHHVPMLILFSMKDCGFCEIIRDEYLQPMQNRDKDSMQILIGEISIESYNYVRDFNGRQLSADVLGLRYSADVSPTVVFVDLQGNELVKSIVGFKGRDYYDLELDKAIEQSIKNFSQ